jgi:hypothetical protein
MLPIRTFSWKERVATKWTLKKYSMRQKYIGTELPAWRVNECRV